MTAENTAQAGQPATQNGDPTAAPNTAPAALATATGFWSGIGQEVETLWHDAETFGEDALEEGEQLVEEEAATVKAIITNTLGTVLPQQLVLLKGWLTTAVAQLGQGASLEQLWTGVLNLAGPAEGAFLKGIEGTVGQALLGGLLTTLEAAL
jgi:hypothetical protein